MPPLRESLKRPQPWLGLVLALLVLGLLDLRRGPDDQLAAAAYVSAVGAYQGWARPLVASRIRCRYRPTCSEYSIGAVQRYGLLVGLGLTWRRLRSCTTAVRAGTLALVP